MNKFNLTKIVKLAKEVSKYTQKSWRDTWSISSDINTKFEERREK